MATAYSNRYRETEKYSKIAFFNFEDIYFLPDTFTGNVIASVIRNAYQYGARDIIGYGLTSIDCIQPGDYVCIVGPFGYESEMFNHVLNYRAYRNSYMNVIDRFINVIDSKAVVYKTLVNALAHQIPYKWVKMWKAYHTLYPNMVSVLVKRYKEKGDIYMTKEEETDCRILIEITKKF